MELRGSKQALHAKAVCLDHNPVSQAPTRNMWLTQDTLTIFSSSFDTLLQAMLLALKKYIGMFTEHLPGPSRAMSLTCVVSRHSSLQKCTMLLEFSWLHDSYLTVCVCLCAWFTSAISPSNRDWFDPSPSVLPLLCSHGFRCGFRLPQWLYLACMLIDNIDI